MSKIIFFDLDGTLRETISGKTFINEPQDQKAIEGTQKALSYYQKKGFVMIGITNQGGVAAGHKSLQSAIEEQRITLQLFPELREVLMCTSYDGQTCWSVSSDRIFSLKSAPDCAFHLSTYLSSEGMGKLSFIRSRFNLKRLL
jgi:D-glycero-D-manno-heptose 1,7-bisphosphate phosphatase